MDSPVDERSLRAATARGFLWTIGQGFAVHVLSLVSFVVLAHLLTPAEYGVAALANVFVTLLLVVGYAGMGTALIQRPAIDKTDLDTVFWIGTAAGVLLAGALSLAAGPLAGALDEPDLEPVLQLLSIAFVFIGLGSTQSAILQRRLAFRALAASAFAANLVATIVGVSFGVAGFGVYALVVQTLLGSVLVTVANAVQAGYRPGRSVSWARFAGLFAYSRHVLGNSLLTFSNTRTDDFLIGGVLGSAALGIYSVGYRVLTIVLDLLTESTKRVAFPVFSRLQDDRVRLAQAYASATRMAAVAAFPLFMFILVTAPLIIPTAFGSQWVGSVPVLQILCLFGPLYALVQFNSSLLESIGRARLVFRVGLVGTVLQVGLFALAVNSGIEWVAAALVARAYLVAPVTFRAASRELALPLRGQCRDILPPVVATAVMAGTVFVVREALVDRIPRSVLLAALLLLAIVVYAVVLRLVGAAVFAEARAYLRSALARAAHPPAVA